MCIRDSANLERVNTMRKRSVVGQLKLVVGIGGNTDLRSSTCKRILNTNRRKRIIGVRAACLMFKLEPSLINNSLIDNSGLSQLDVVFRTLVLVFTRRQ